MHEIGSLVVQSGDVASDALGGRDTILVAGNGLALDLFYNLSDFKVWNPSSPLQWNIRNPFTENESLLEALPHAHDRVKRVLRSSPDAHDFEVFRQALDGYDIHDDLTLRTAVELRHFLSHCILTLPKGDQARCPGPELEAACIYSKHRPEVAGHHLFQL